MSDAYAGYWVAYALTFQSHGRLLVSDPGNDRYPTYLRPGGADSRLAWVFPRRSTLGALDAVVGAHPWFPGGSVTPARLERSLRLSGFSFRSEPAGYFTIVLPGERRVATRQSDHTGSGTGGGRATKAL